MYGMNRKEQFDVGVEAACRNGEMLVWKVRWHFQLHQNWKLYSPASESLPFFGPFHVGTHSITLAACLPAPKTEWVQKGSIHVHERYGQLTEHWMSFLPGSGSRVVFALSLSFLVAFSLTSASIGVGTSAVPCKILTHSHLYRVAPLTCFKWFNCFSYWQQGREKVF